LNSTNLLRVGHRGKNGTAEFVCRPAAEALKTASNSAAGGLRHASFKVLIYIVLSPMEGAICGRSERFSLPSGERDGVRGAAERVSVIAQTRELGPQRRQRVTIAPLRPGECNRHFCHHSARRRR
jgi:hypothetical protein